MKNTNSVNFIKKNKNVNLLEESKNKLSIYKYI